MTIIVNRLNRSFLEEVKLLIIHNLNLLTKLSCFSVSAFAVSPFYKNMYILSQNSQLKYVLVEV